MCSFNDNPLNLEYTGETKTVVAMNYSPTQYRLLTSFYFVALRPFLVVFQVCNMMTVSELDRLYHEDTGIVFSSMYPGCIAETALFREKRQWFRKLFPAFMKYVTGGYVGEEEAGDRLAQVIDDPQCNKSGVYWSWNGGAKTVGRWSEDGKPRGAGGSGGEIFENEQSDAVRDVETAKKMWALSKKAVGLSDKEMYKGGKLEKA
mmetsp:Transcript_31461/g.76156  ORF Transcript_31461/g.76156 Transcript_31461/m.76156 type:complete len:204 (+) Transcript_31461:1543-2154(+)